MNALEVKQQNEQRLHALSVAVNPALPQIEQPSELRPRPSQKVATRAWVLTYVMGVGFGRSADDVLDQLRATDLLDFLTPRERGFLRKPRFSHSDRAWAACLSEAVHGCAWAMGLLETGPLKNPHPRWRLISPTATRIPPSAPPVFAPSTISTSEPISTTACTGQPAKPASTAPPSHSRRLHPVPPPRTRLDRRHALRLGRHTPGYVKWTPDPNVCNLRALPSGRRHC